MTTLDAIAPLKREVGEHNDIGVIASDIIYQGAAVGDNGSGYARPLVSGDPFKGFAQTTVDNSSGSAGDINVRVWRRAAFQLNVASVAITDVGRPVYASDDNTYALAGVGTKIGYVKRFISSGVCIVQTSDEPESTYELTIPLALAGITDADALTDYPMAHHGRVVNSRFVVDVPVTTASKATTLNIEIGATDITGGAVALTSANCTPLGVIVEDAAITALAGFKKGDTLSIVASATTAFAEGSGSLIITIGQ